MRGLRGMRPVLTLPGRRGAAAGDGDPDRSEETPAAGPSGAWPFVLVVFGLSRLLFFGVGALAAALLPRVGPARGPRWLAGPLGYWANWDGAWYAEIAADGYGENAPASTAFFPLYPLLVRLGIALGGGPVLWGIAVSLVASVFALYFVYRLAEHLYDVRAARAATLAMAFFPTAFFLNAVYTEALFLALAAGSVWAARVRRNLLLAGVLGALAAATRNPGIFLLAPLFYEWLRGRREFGWRGLAALGLVPAGLVAYASFLWIRFGDPLLFARQQQKWGRELANPVSTLEHALGGAVRGAKRVLDPAALFVGDTVGPSFQFSHAVGLAVLVVCLFLLGAGFAGLPPGLSVYAFVVVLQPVLVPSYYLPLMSLPRLVLGAFPVFLVLGFLLSRSKPGLPLYLAACACTGTALTALFATWRWVA